MRSRHPRFSSKDKGGEGVRAIDKARQSELAWVKALLESQLVAVDYPDVIPRINARMKAIEAGKEP